MANGSRLPEGLYEYSPGTDGWEAPNTLPIGPCPSVVEREAGLTELEDVGLPAAGSAETMGAMARTIATIIPVHVPYHRLYPSTIGFPFLLDRPLHHLIWGTVATGLMSFIAAFTSGGATKAVNSNSV